MNYVTCFMNGALPMIDEYENMVTMCKIETDFGIESLEFFSDIEFAEDDLLFILNAHDELFDSLWHWGD